MKPLLGQIVGLTRAIHLKPKDASDHAWLQFIAGKARKSGVTGGIGLSWWADDRTHSLIESVASMVVSETGDLMDCDLATSKEAVLQALQEFCLNKKIFDSDSVAFSRKPTLFDCRCLDVPGFAGALLDAIQSNLRHRLARHCTVFALPRFLSNSFQLPTESVHLASTGDFDSWRVIQNEGFAFNGWSPSRPRLDGQEDAAFTPNRKFDSVLVSSDYGTRAGAHFSSIMKFRRVIAVIYATVSAREKYPIHKSVATPLRFCVQFPHGDSAVRSISRRDSQPLVPVYASNVEVLDRDIQNVREWFDAVARGGIEARGRAEKGAHFFNRAMNADDIESFINYFVTLDAIFGQRGSVEESILDGVRELILGPVEIEKTRWLFDLRSELVHGGSRHVAEWPKHARYRDHFQSNPVYDVQAIARTALLQAPIVLNR